MQISMGMLLQTDHDSMIAIMISLPKGPVPISLKKQPVEQVQEGV